MQAEGQLTVRLLGPVEVRAADGRDLTPPGRKLRALLACLALSNGKGWARERLSALLWGDRDEEQARASLRQALAELRRLLGEPSPIRADRDMVGLDPVAAMVDVVEFDRLAAGGEVERAALLYRGDLLDGMTPSDAEFASWLAVERMRLHDLAVDVLMRLARSQTGETAIATAQRLLQFDPLREEGHRLLMRLYAANGQRALALRQYQICRDLLQRDLNVKPEPETELVHKQIQSSNGAIGTALARPIQERPKVSDPDLPQSGPHSDGPAPVTLRKHAWLAMLTATVLVLVGATLLYLHSPADRQDGFPSLVVLPFANLSGDPALGAYADGITEDLITMASRFPDFSVVSRSSGFAYKDKPVDPVQIGRDLKVDYVIQGSVQQKGDKVRISAQLVDAHTNRHLWGDEYEASERSPLQDEAVEKIIASLSSDEGAIKKNEYQRTKGKATADLTEYDYYLRGHEIFMRFEGIEEHDRAGAIWREGLEKFPDSGLLRVKLAWYHFFRPWEFHTDRPAADLKKAGEFAREALASQNPSLMVQWLGHWLMAYINWHEGDFIHAVRDAEMAVSLNPHDANAMSFLARVQMAAGNPKRAIEWVEASMRLKPNIPRNTRILAWAYYLIGDYEKSIEAAQQHEELSREFPSEAYLYIAVSNVRLGRIMEARAAVQTLLKLEPKWSLATERAWDLDWPYKDKAIFDRWVADLSRAGYPELPFEDTLVSYERLSAEEMKALTFGHTIRGRDLDTGQAFVDVIAADGTVTETGDLGPDTAKIAYVTDNLICHHWTDWGGSCGSMFRKPAGSSQQRDELLYVMTCCRYVISIDK